MENLETSLLVPFGKAKEEKKLTLLDLLKFGYISMIDDNYVDSNEEHEGYEFGNCDLEYKIVSCYSFVDASKEVVYFDHEAPVELGEKIVLTDIYKVKHEITLENKKQVSIDQIQLGMSASKYYKFNIVYCDGASSYTAASAIAFPVSLNDHDLKIKILEVICDALSLSKANDGNYGLTSKYMSVYIEEIEKIELDEFYQFKKSFPKETY